MHIFVLLHDYTMSTNLSAYASCVKQFILFVHVFVCNSDLPGFFVCIIIISFASHLKLFALSITSQAMWSGKSCWWLLYIDSLPFWLAAYLPWPGSYFTFWGIWGTFHDHVWGVSFLGIQSSFPSDKTCLDTVSWLWWMEVARLLSYHLSLFVVSLLSSYNLSLCAICVCECAIYDLNILLCSACIVSMKMT